MKSKKFKSDRFNNYNFKFLFFSFIIIFFIVLTFARNSIWEQDITLWSDVVKKSSSKARPLSNLGNMYNYRGDIEKAMFYYSKSLEKDPSFIYPYAPMASIYGQKGHLEKAKNLITYFLRYFPKDVRARNTLGVIFLLEKKYDESKKQFLIAYKENPGDKNTISNLNNINRILKTYK